MNKTIRLSQPAFITFCIYLAVSLFFGFVRLFIPNQFSFINSFIGITLSVFFLFIVTLLYIELRKFYYKRTLLSVLYALYLTTIVFDLFYNGFFFYIVTFGTGFISSDNFIPILETLSFLSTLSSLLSMVLLTIGFVLIIVPLMPKVTNLGLAFLILSAFNFILLRLLFSFFMNRVLVIDFMFYILGALAQVLSFFIVYRFYNGDYTYQITE
jgi:hypothetical protein